MWSRSRNRMLNVYLLKDFEYLIYPEHWDRWCELKIVSHFNTMPRVKESKGGQVRGGKNLEGKTYSSSVETFCRKWHLS